MHKEIGSLCIATTWNVTCFVIHQSPSPLLLTCLSPWIFPSLGFHIPLPTTAYPSYSHWTFLLKFASWDIVHLVQEHLWVFAELLPLQSSLNLLCCRSFTLLVTFQTASDVLGVLWLQLVYGDLMRHPFASWCSEEIQWLKRYFEAFPDWIKTFGGK